MDNRRNFVRVDHQLLVNYARCDRDGGKDEGMGKSLNVSGRGLLLLLPRRVEVGMILQLALDFESEVVEVVGEVVRCSADPDDDGMFDVGIELSHVPARFTESVDRFFSGTPSRR